MTTLSLRSKIMVAFLGISIITAIVGITSYIGMKAFEKKFDLATESAPLIQTATQMKLTISQDLMIVMKLMAALDTDELNEIWNRHELYSKAFGQSSKAILNGAELHSGRVYPAKDKILREIVMNSVNNHSKAFLPSFKIIFDQMSRKLSAESYDYDILDTIDEKTIEIGSQLNTELGKVVEIAQAIINKAQDDAGKTKALVANITLAATGLGILSAILLGYVFSGIVTRSIIETADFTKIVASGDFTKSLDINKKDEIGMMASSMNKMVDSLAHIFRDITKGVVTLNDTASQLSDISRELEVNASVMSEGSKAVSTSSEKMSQRLSAVSSLSENSSASLDSVSAAMEEMSSTTGEISKNTGNARKITEAAVEKAHAASKRINELGNEANEIGQVTEVIAEISDQTNLLALNATIEAARAGDAGKGFAVVANEIKDLAQQTAKAASNISVKIEQVQNSTKGTVLEIEEISNVINEVNEIVSSIARAVEEQSVSSNEIANNITTVVDGAHETNDHIAESSIQSEKIVNDIVSINENSALVDSSSRKVAESTSELTRFSISLNDILANFKI